MTNYDAKDKQKHKLKQEGIGINLKINKKDQGLHWKSADWR